MSDPRVSGSLDLTSLRAVVLALGNALDVTASPEFKLADPRWRDTLVAGVVQHFEFTFELCWKTLKRQLEQELPSPTMLESMHYRDLIRLGHERGLIVNVLDWFDFRELRNITSHTYAREKAAEVAAGAVKLLGEAKILLAATEVRQRG